MKAKVVGTRRLEFTDNKTGELIAGVQVFVIYPDYDVVGEKTDKVFVSDSSGVKLPEFVLGSEYVFNYDSVGFGRYARNKLVSIEPNF